MNPVYDFAVIGAGIAGASVAAQLAGNARVLLLEQDSQAGYHTTGRSAAMYVPAYGPPAIRALTRAAGPFFTNPPEGFSATPLLAARDTVLIARPDQHESVEAFLAEMEGEIEIRQLEGNALMEFQPLLRPGYADMGLVDPSGSDIDVHALLHGFLRLFRACDGTFAASQRVTALTRCNDKWQIKTDRSEFKARVIINAAGAWADEIGQLAGAEMIGLVPKRRTALTIAAPEGRVCAALPMTVDIDEMFYLKPDAGQLLISPANEDPMPPCDAQPDILDIATCIDRIEQAFSLVITRPTSKWAGLRSFVSDKTPVVGFSTQVEGFFWLAGQGGYGIQTSPALARVAACLVQGQALPDDILAAGVTAASIAPDRLVEI